MTASQVTKGLSRESSTLLSHLLVIARRKRVVLLSALLVPAVAVALSLQQQELYEAEADVLVEPNNLATAVSGVQQEVVDPQRFVDTQVQIASVPEVRRLATRSTGEVRTPEHLLEQGSVSSSDTSNVLTFTVRDEDTKVATQLATAWARQFTAYRQRLGTASIREALDDVNTRIADLERRDKQSSNLYGKLVRNRDSLDALQTLGTSNATVVRSASGAVQVQPRTVRNAVLGVLLGIGLGVALVFLFERLDRRLRDSEEVEDIFERPVLAVVPETSHLSEGDQRVAAALSSREAEAFRMLRANLRYFNVDRQIKSVLVTSASPGDGKSTVAWHLAAAAAAAGDKVLLVEADLRNPSFRVQHGLSSSPGLTTVLTGQADPDDLLHEVPVGSAIEGGDVPTMYVLTAGPLPPNPTDLMESDAMRSLLRDAEADLVVVDTPPTSVVSDAIPLLREVSGVIVVVRLEKNTRESTSHLRDQLHNLGARTLGIVVNGMSRQSASYGYGYGYGYGRNGTGATAKDAIASKVRS